MLKKYLTLVVAVLVINLSLGSVAFAETKEEKIAKTSEKIKSNITKLGTGQNAQVEVKLRDKTKINGYITEISDDSFTVMNAKTNSLSKISYPQAKQVKGNNLSTGVKIAIGVGILVAVVVLVCAFSKNGCEN